MSMLDNDPAIEPWHHPHYARGMEMRNGGAFISTIKPKRSICFRIIQRMILWSLRADLASTERYLRDAERVGLMSESELAGFRRYCQGVRVRIAAWEAK